jgi:hypothetical protein
LEKLYETAKRRIRSVLSEEGSSHDIFKEHIDEWINSLKREKEGIVYGY